MYQAALRWKRTAGNGIHIWQRLTHGELNTWRRQSSSNKKNHFIELYIVHIDRCEDKGKLISANGIPIKVEFYRTMCDLNTIKTTIM